MPLVQSRPGIFIFLFSLDRAGYQDRSIARLHDYISDFIYPDGLKNVRAGTTLVTPGSSRRVGMVEPMQPRSTLRCVMEGLPATWLSATGLRFIVIASRSFVT
jgi:hypothetical protein